MFGWKHSNDEIIDVLKRLAESHASNAEVLAKLAEVVSSHAKAIKDIQAHLMEEWPQGYKQ